MDEKKNDNLEELCNVLEKLKEGLCVDSGENKNAEAASNSNVLGANKQTIVGPGIEAKVSEKQPTEEQPPIVQPSTQQSNNAQSLCKVIVKIINRIKCVGKKDGQKPFVRKSDMDFVDDELEKVRPKKPTQNKKCGCVVFLLVLCLFFPLTLLFLRSFYPTQNAVILDNNKVCLTSTTKSESNDDKCESSNKKINGEGLVVFGTAVLDGDNNTHVKQDGKSNLVMERKQKESCCREILFGISTIVLMGGVLCVIVIYIKHLQKRQEREFDIDNSILEFNKRVYFELLKLRTSELAIMKLSKEQELELKKQLELSNIDEKQRSSDYKWKQESKRFDLQEKYLEKAAEVANKYFETHPVERTERDLKKEVTHGLKKAVTRDFDVDIEIH